MDFGKSFLNCPKHIQGIYLELRNVDCSLVSTDLMSNYAYMFFV